MVDVKNLCVSYGAKHVLENFTHTFESGTFTAVRGESGAGKTTLLSVVAGIVKPDSGEVKTDGKVRMVFQTDRLLPWLTAYENVAAVCDDADFIDSMFSSLGISAEKGSKLREMSGGQRQRAAIRRALCAKPDILLLDEPFSALDSDTARKTADVIRRQMTGKTLILVTHSDEMSEYLCDNSIEIK